MLTSPSCALRASSHQIREQRSVLVGNKWGRTRRKKWPELTQWQYLLYGTMIVLQMCLFSVILYIWKKCRCSIAVSITYLIDLWGRAVSGCLQHTVTFLLLKLSGGVPDWVSHEWKIAPPIGELCMVKYLIMFSAPFMEQTFSVGLRFSGEVKMTTNTPNLGDCKSPRGSMGLSFGLGQTSILVFKSVVAMWPWHSYWTSPRKLSQKYG